MESVQGSEIVTIGIGQAGVNILNEFYSTIMDEHKIDENGKFTGNYEDDNDKWLMFKYSTYFNHNKQNDRYIPRAIFIDCDQHSINSLQASNLGSLMPDEHFYLTEHSQPMMTWAKGFYKDGYEMVNDTMDIIRREFESHDVVQGYQFFNSIQGGLGGGFGSRLLQEMRNEYPDKPSFMYNVYPSTSSHHYVFAVYNCILTIAELLNNSDYCFVLDNDRCLNIAEKQCKLEHPTYDDLNWLISQVLSGQTSTLRFHAEPQINVTMRAFGVAMASRWRLKFFSLSHSPFYGKHSYTYNSNVNGITKELLTNDVSNVELKDNKIMNMSISFRGNDENAMADMDEYILSIQHKMSNDFVKWIPEMNVHSAFIYDGDNHFHDKYAPVIGTATIATTAIQELFKKIAKSFKRLYRRKAYLHWYKDDTMDEMEFNEAHKNVKDLIAEYQV